MIPRRKVVAWEIGHAFNSELTQKNYKNFAAFESQYTFV